MYFRYPYAALAEKAWGKEIGKFINVYINIAIFCSNIPVLLLGKCLCAAGRRDGSDSF